MKEGEEGRLGKRGEEMERDSELIIAFSPKPAKYTSQERKYRKLDYCIWLTSVHTVGLVYGHPNDAPRCSPTLSCYTLVVTVGHPPPISANQKTVL